MKNPTYENKVNRILIKNSHLNIKNFLAIKVLKFPRVDFHLCINHDPHFSKTADYVFY